MYQCKCKNCWEIYRTSYKYSQFCDKFCKQEYNSTYNEDLSLPQKKKVLKTKIPYCKDCNYSEHPEILEVHHIIPLEDGGSNDFKNLSLLCPSCHSIRHLKLRNIKKKE